MKHEIEIYVMKCQIYVVIPRSRMRPFMDSGEAGAVVVSLYREMTHRVHS